MKKNILKLIFLTILILLVILIFVFFYYKLFSYNKYEGNIDSYEFILDNNDKYLVTTDTKYMTMQNDGGSHINVYYEIDLKNNVSNKYEDNYKGFQVYIYKHKLISSKKLNNIDVTKLKELFNNIVENRNNNNDDTLNYNYYTISTIDYENLKIYNQTIIDDFLNIVDNQNGDN